MTISDLYPTCKRCGSPDRKVYQAGIVLDAETKYGELISMYRCYCAFCDDCLREVKALHSDTVYIPLDEDGRMPTPSPYLDEMFKLYHAVTRSLDTLEGSNDSKWKVFTAAMDAMKPSTAMYDRWLLDTYHDNRQVPDEMQRGTGVEEP